MTTPMFLLGASVLFWGWRVEALWIAVPIAIVLEASRWIQARFTFSQHDLDRLWNLCVALFVGSAVLSFALNDGFDAVGAAATENTPSQRLALFNKGATSALRFLQYLPATILPIMLAQAFAQQPRFAWSTFSLFLRRRRRTAADGTSPAAEPGGLNVTPVYLAIVLFAAALSSSPGPAFTAGFAPILAWALWSRRPRTYPAKVWVSGLLAAIGLGALAQLGLVQLQQLIRDLDATLMSKLASGGKGYDRNGTRTKIGELGGMQQSGGILFRVETEPGVSPPPLLREASYDLYKEPMWASTKRQLERTLPDATETTWPLVPRLAGRARVTIASYLDGGKGLLPLPSGSVRLSQLPVFLLQTNSHGAVQVEEGPGFVRYQAHYEAGPTLDAAPGPEDLKLPETEMETLQAVAAELGLPGKGSAEAIGLIRAHFGRHFEYSTWRGLNHLARSNRTALAGFLLEHRSGHCEYFATATTLLLRAAGIPARYAVGYAVQESRGSGFVVRGRHAHAWGLAWVDGHWQDVDTTPGGWAAVEAGSASFWEPIRDLFSEAWYVFSKWRWGPTEWKRYLPALIVPLIGLLAYRILRQNQWRRVRPSKPGAGSSVPRPGLDSELYRIEQHLVAQGLVRPPGQTLAQWLTALSSGKSPLRPGAPAVAPEHQELLRQMVRLHSRLRFDPDGLSPAERTDLRDAVARWLRTQGATDSASGPVSAR